MNQELFDQDNQVSSNQPLAEAVRPQQLSEVIGQEKLLGPGKVLTTLIEQGRLPSTILWGPPGSGKTTLARLVAKHGNYYFKEFSAVTSGIADIKQVVEEAKARQQLYQQPTIVFIDEIHRFNKSQQDAFLPHVEAGIFTLIGATTENPSFSIVSALLSRSRVFVLEPLQEEHLNQILDTGLQYLQSHNRTTHQISIDDIARKQLIQIADGDARRLLTALDIAAQLAKSNQYHITSQIIAQALQHKHLHYDKGGEEHYNLISALHKSIRDSDPQGAVYWLARMLEAGEDPIFVARRLTRAAAEDIGLADPQALILANATMQSAQQIGMPESNVILAELAIYLSLAPKSNAVYMSYNQAKKIIETTDNQPVPLHLRNAPTKLMKGIGYGKGYQYAHDAPNAKVDQQHLPDNLIGTTFYTPQRGWEISNRPTFDKDVSKSKPSKS